MSKLNRVSIAVLLIVLPLASVACNGDSNEVTSSVPAPTIEIEVAPTADSTPKPTRTPPPPPTGTPLPPPTGTPTPEPTETPEPEKIWDVATLAQPGDLDRFRSSLAISWEGNDSDDAQVVGSMELLVEFVREPLAQHVRISGSLPKTELLVAQESGMLDMFLIEGVMYTNLLGTWIQVRAEKNALGGFADMALVVSDEMLKGLKFAMYEGPAAYNGIETKHFSFDQTSFEAEETGGSKIEEASGDLYLAAEGNYLVHLAVTMTGTDLQVPSTEGDQILKNGTVEILVDLSSINEAITIQVPEEALAGIELPLGIVDQDVPQDIPLPDNAEGLKMSSFGLIAFSSLSSSEELAEFYQVEMPQNGWNEIEVEQAGELFSLKYARDSRTANLTIAPDNKTGWTAVWITITAQ